MKKHIILLCLVVLVFTVMGCQPSGTQVNTENYQQGVEEVQARFIENLPPEEIYPNSRFMMVAEVINEMGYDIHNGYVKIVGLDPKYVELYPTAQPFPLLRGKSFALPEGEKVLVE